MNRRNWLSALLAVMMVISMLTCIALPAVAETDYSMLPYASSSYLNDGVSEYQIDSVSELLAASINYITDNASSNDKQYAIDDGDTIYLTADLNIADWDVSKWATENPDGTYTTIGKFGVSTGNWRKYDKTAEGIVCANKQEVFYHLYNGFNARNAGYTHIRFNFNGLNHTIDNYYSRTAFIGGGVRSDGRVYENIIFTNALVDTTKQDESLWTVDAAAIFVNSTEGGSNAGVYVKNAHFYNCKVITDTDSQAGIVFKASSNGTATARCLYLDNCSVIGCTLENTSPATNNNSLLVGALENGGHIKNCIVANSTLKIRGTGYNAKAGGTDDAYHSQYAVNSFITSDIYNRIAVNAIENVAVVNCTLLTEEVAEPHFGIILAAGNNLTKTSQIPMNHIYVTGNTWATVTNGVAGTANSLSSLTYTRRTDVESKLSFGSDMLLDDVAYIYKNEKKTGTAVPADKQADNLQLQTILDKMNDNLAVDVAKWKLNADGVVVPVEPIVMTFVFVDESTKVLYSDENGRFTVDAATKAILANEDWVDEYDLPVTLNYDDLSAEEDITYYMVPHALRYEGNGDQTHNIICDKCDEHDVANVSCTPVEDPENDVAPGYFTPASLAYKCEFCSNTWAVPQSSEDCPAPYTLTFDKVDYYNNGSVVLLTLAAETDANLNALTVDITFPAANLTYVEYTPVEGYMATVNTKNAAEGKLSVTLAKVDGTTLTAADAAVLKFTTLGLDETNATAYVTATAEVTALIVDEGDTSVKKTPENKVASDNAVITYLVIGDFIAGDINSDGTVTLLDAALLIQKMNGTIHPKQDGANFMVMAADVNSDGAADTGDVVLLLRVATLMEVNLVKATEIPVIAYVE